MAFSWPEFAANIVIDEKRSWTAVFDSYDQYRELCYYVVRIFYGGQQVDEVTAVVGTEFAGDDWTTPAFDREVRERIAQALTAHTELWGVERA
ncbi:hypothetical protein MXD61_11505 [Frankia sp. AgPm24]|uniref:hypothetical protein n=1 Tax=Frankia sp. AgPm24 TaxID=631128 RepID=UPI00200C23F6|nr:hypothetical protein [Frankia sp. AgPm24]MCK9922497.1 hypothetical protein [Frankia sp. AgPm24]